MTDSAQASRAELPQDDLLATKLFTPAFRRHLVHRTRLIDDLAGGLTSTLIVVVAPAGWGKTSLLADWLDARHEHAPSVAWITLDETDNDLVRFLRYLIRALQMIDPDLGRVSLSHLQPAQPPTAETVLTPLLNELAALSSDVVLVLDDYHVIESQAIHRALTFLLEHLPPSLHLVIATRVDPPLPLARLRARDRLTELRATDLAFTEEEARGFLNEAMGLALSADEVAVLEARTEGWIAGLHLAALTLRDRSPEDRHDFITALSGTHRYILDYLAGEVYDLQQPCVRRFLLHTSILGGLNGDLCDAVLGGADAPGHSQAMLERLDEVNLFVVRLDDTRTWYRYHHLFAEFLRERLRREQAALIPELHRRAAHWLEENGRPIYAAEHALAAEDFDEAARLIESVIGAIIWQRGEILMLRRWLDRLPRTATRKRPRLSLDLAWTLLWSAQADAIEPRLQDVEQSLVGTSEASARALRGEMAAIRAELARQRGEVDGAIAMARQALADLPPDARLVRGATSGLLGQALLVNGNAVAAGHAFAQAASLGQVPHTLSLAFIAQGRLLQTQALQGRFDLAGATYRQTIESAEPYGMVDSPAAGVAQVYMAEVLRERNDLARAEDLVREGLAHCTQWPGLAEMALDGYVTLARLLAYRGEVDGAFAALTAAESLGRDAHVSQYGERLALARVRLWLAAGDAAVTRWARAQEQAWRAGVKPRYLSLQERIMLARLYLAQGTPDDALAVLEGLATISEAGGLTGCLIEIQVLRALSLKAQGQTAQAMIALSHALSQAEPQGYVRLFLDEGAPTVGLLRQARSRGMAHSFIGRILDAADAAGLNVPDERGLIEPLSERELELLTLLASGLSTSEIADRLFITTGTARNHLKNIYGKLDVHSRVQAIERARALNLLRH